MYRVKYHYCRAIVKTSNWVKNNEETFIKISNALLIVLAIDVVLIVVGNLMR